MYGLTSILSVASDALNADTGALAVTNNNIANVNTTGYSRQIVNLSASALEGSGTPQDNGVTFEGYSSVRDQVLQLGINQKTSDAGSLSTQSASWSAIETAFSGTDTGLGATLASLFSGLSGLSTNPQDAATRQTALSAASEVVDAFHQAASSLADAQSDADQTVAGTVAQVNQLSTQIASLDQQLSQAQSSGQDGGSIQDQRDQLTTQLSQLVGVNVISTGTTLTLALSNGTPLVMGGTAYSLQAATGTDGKTHVLDSDGQDITSTTGGGSLGGALEIRDSSVPALSSTLNQLASQFATSMNAAQATGYDANGNPGQPMFSLPSGVANAAAGISLALSSASGIAASSDGSAGGSGNISNLLAVQTQSLPSGQTPESTYAGLVQSIGVSGATVTANLNATNSALSQLTTQQSSESGVSVDQETTNLLRYQQAYSAAAQVINTVNNLFSVTLNMMTVTS